MKWWSPCESIGVGVYKWTWNSCGPSWDFDKVNLYMVEPIGVGGVGGVSKMRTTKRGTQRLPILRLSEPSTISAAASFCDLVQHWLYAQFPLGRVQGSSRSASLLVGLTGSVFVALDLPQLLVIFGLPEMSPAALLALVMTQSLLDIVMIIEVFW